MEFTKNFNFALPSRDTDDVADINVISENFRKVDATIFDQTYNKLFPELTDEMIGKDLDGFASPSAVVNYTNDKLIETSETLKQYADETSVNMARNEIASATLKKLYSDMTEDNSGGIPAPHAVVEYVEAAKKELQEQISGISTSDAKITLDVPIVADYVQGEEAYLYASGLVNTRDLHWQERLRITQYGNLVQGETWGTDKIIKVKQTATKPTGMNNKFFLTKSLDNSQVVGDMVSSRAFVWSKPTNPDTTKNILVVGDSYTARGTWLKHMTTDHMGNLSNYKFIGRNTTGGVKHEATNGYAWNNYLCDPDTLPSGTINPFWDTETGTVNIKKYVDTYAGVDANLDYVICLLGYNARVTNAWWTDVYNKDEASAIASVRQYATEFINIVHTAYPTCKILLAGYALPPFIDGVNNSKWFEMFSRADFVHLMNETYKELATAYPDYVRFAHTTSGIDAVNGYTIDETTINHMTYQTIPDDLHLNDLGQHQLAEVMWRSFVGLVNM